MSNDSKIMSLNRHYTERAQDYWNREYLDYADNNWYLEQHVVRILIPVLECLLTKQEER